MQKKTKSLLQELNELASHKNNESIIEARAMHIINSAINLLGLIRENFDSESAYELERRFINSIKCSDATKFTRGIRKLKDNKETAKSLKLIEGNKKDD